MTPRCVQRGIFAAIVCCAVDAGAADDHAALVAVSAPPELMSGLQSVLEAAVAKQDWGAHTVDPATATALARCVSTETASCVASLFSHASASDVLFVRVEAKPDDDGDEQVSVRGWLIARATGKVVGVAQRHCSGCGGAERIGHLAGAIAVELIRARARTTAPATSVRVTTHPSDAMVSIDGNAPQASGDVRTLTPGTHTLVVTRQGYQSVTKRIEVGRSEQRVLDITLEKQAAATQAGTSTLGPAYLPYVLGGAAGVSLIVGITWIAIHRDPVEGSGTNRRRNATSRDSRTHGIVATSLGLVLGGAAGYLWYRNRERPGPTPVALTPLPGGGGVLSFGGLL